MAPVPVTKNIDTFFPCGNVERGWCMRRGLDLRMYTGMHMGISMYGVDV